MSEFETVLAAIDGGEISSDVLRLARLFAGLDKGGRFFVAHVVRDLPADYIDLLNAWACFGDDTERLRAELVQRATATIAKRFRDLLPAPAADALHVVPSEPKAGIQSIIGLTGPTLIVAGSAGARAHAPGMLGSVATWLARTAATPVLLAARTAPESRTVQTIVVAVDLTADSRALLQTILPIAARLGAAVQPVYVAPTVDHLDHAGLVAVHAPDGKADPRQPKGGKDPRKVWAQLEDTLGLSFSLREQARELLRKPIFRQGDAAEQVLDVARQTQAELIAVARCRHAAGNEFRLGRTAWTIASHAHCHVLVVPSASAEAA
jgi:nucleotide-binding universal stress UspA family protein